MEQDVYIQTTIGQLNFFKWALENKILHYIEKNFTAINNDMNKRNSTAKNRKEKSTKQTQKEKRRIIYICFQEYKKRASRNNRRF